LLLQLLLMLVVGGSKGGIIVVVAVVVVVGIMLWEGKKVRLCRELYGTFVAFGSTQ